jgi:hypothetical protein
MEQSILVSTKKILGISPMDESFDLDITTHINSAISVLQQVGLAVSGFIDSDGDTEWEEVFGENPQLPLIKTCVYLQVRVLFDPPVTSYLLSAAQGQIQEHVWRLNVGREDVEWVDPDPPGVLNDV